MGKIFFEEFCFVLLLEVTVKEEKYEYLIVTNVNFDINV